MKPLPGERRVAIPRQRSPETIPGLWRPGPGGAALVFHATLPRSIDGLTREIAAALGPGTLRLLFRPPEWNRRPTRGEVRRRVPMARAALRWLKEPPRLLVGISMGAMVAAKVAVYSRAAAVVLLAPPFRHARLGESWRRWLPEFKAYPGRRVVIVGDRDREWAPLPLVRSLLRGWAELRVVRGADHALKGWRWNF